MSAFYSWEPPALFLLPSVALCHKRASAQTLPRFRRSHSIGSIPFDLITRMAAGPFRNPRHCSIAMGAEEEPTGFCHQATHHYPPVRTRTAGRVRMLAIELAIRVAPATWDSRPYRKPKRTPKKPDGRAPRRTADRAVSW